MKCPQNQSYPNKITEKYKQNQTKILRKTTNSNQNLRKPNKTKSKIDKNNKPK